MKSTFKLNKSPVSMKVSGQFATFQLIRDFHFRHFTTLPWTIRDVPSNIVHETLAYQFQFFNSRCESPLTLIRGR